MVSVTVPIRKMLMAISLLGLLSAAVVRGGASTDAGSVETNSIGIRMVVIEPGSFVMGNTDTESVQNSKGRNTCLPAIGTNNPPTG